MHALRDAISYTTLTFGLLLGFAPSRCEAADLQIETTEYGTLDATLAAIQRRELIGGELLHVRVLRENRPLRCGEFHLTALGDPPVFEVEPCNPATNTSDVYFRGQAAYSERRAQGPAGALMIEATIATAPPAGIGGRRSTAGSPGMISTSASGSERNAGGSLAAAGGVVVLLGFCTGGAVLWALASDEAYVRAHPGNDAVVIATVIGGGIMTIGGIMSIVGAVMYTPLSRYSGRDGHGARGRFAVTVAPVPVGNGAMAGVGFTF